jgi:hypothetical protein
VLVCSLAIIVDDHEVVASSSCEFQVVCSPKAISRLYTVRVLNVGSWPSSLTICEVVEITNPQRTHWGSVCSTHHTSSTTNQHATTTARVRPRAQYTRSNSRYVSTTARVPPPWNTPHYSEMHTDLTNKKRPIEDGEDDEQGDRAMQEGLPARKKKRAHRGKRSEKARTERLQNYVKSGGPKRSRMTINDLTRKNFEYDEATKLITKIEISHPSHYPDDFVDTRRDQKIVRKTVSKEYPDAQHPENLPVVPSLPHGILHVPTPKPELDSDPDHPPYMILRLVSIVPEWVQLALLDAWDQVKATSPRHYIKSEEARSATPAYHFGIWEVTALAPYITRESKDQTANAILAIDKLLRLVKELVVPKMISMIKEYLPVQWKHQER